MRSLTKLSIFVMLFSATMPGESLADKKEYRSPESVAGAVTTSSAQAKALFDEGEVFIDVRNPRLYAKGHIPGAFHLDFKYNYDEEKLNKVAAKDQPVVIYCSGEVCSRSSRASEKAISWGFSKVYYFRGGIVDWKKAGYAIEAAEGGQGTGQGGEKRPDLKK